MLVRVTVVIFYVVGANTIHFAVRINCYLFLNFILQFYVRCVPRAWNYYFDRFRYVNFDIFTVGYVFFFALSTMSRLTNCNPLAILSGQNKQLYSYIMNSIRFFCENTTICAHILTPSGVDRDNSQTQTKLIVM